MRKTFIFFFKFLLNIFILVFFDFGYFLILFIFRKMKKSLIVIPFGIDIKNSFFDNDVYQHAKETLSRMPNAINQIFTYQSKDDFAFQITKCLEQTKEIVTLELFVVSHATLTTLGNDDDKKMDAKEVSSRLINITQCLIKNIPGIRKCSFYLFACQTGEKLVHQIGENFVKKFHPVIIEFFGINGFIGQIKNKKHIYVSCSLGVPARYRYQQRLVKFIA